MRRLPKKLEMSLACGDFSAKRGESIARSDNYSLDRRFSHLFRSAEAGISRVVRGLLTGYVVTFNHKYNRQGQLFQKRYKSIICEEDAYLKELVRLCCRAWRTACQKRKI